MDKLHARPLRLLLGLAAILGAGLSADGARAEPPQRIVSLTVCTDQTNVPRTTGGDVAACFAKGAPPK